MRNMEGMLLRLITEVRHTLHGMLGFLELAGEEPLSERQRGCLAQCASSADGLLRLAGDLWELSHAEAAPAAQANFHAAAAVSEVAGMARAKAARKGLSFECNFSTACYASIAAERSLIQDTLRRVLDNTIQFTARGSIHLSADLSTQSDGARLILEITATGTGLPEEVLASLRSDQEIPAEAGLGLAVVQRRIAAMKGEVSVISHPDAGTIVRLTVPVRFVRFEEAPAVSPTENGRIPSPRLLVAEDSDDSYFVFDAYVTPEGYRLTRAHDGIQAIELAQSDQFDMIVMDANMPRLDGYSATRAIREWESSTRRSERVPILLFSADDPRRQAALGGAAGCSGYLAKPASKAEVLRALNYFSRRVACVS